MMEDVISRLKEFIENEGKSCSFDPELIMPVYVYRMWGGQVPFHEIEQAMADVRGIKKIVVMFARYN